MFGARVHIVQYFLAKRDEQLYVSYPESVAMVPNAKWLNINFSVYFGLHYFRITCFVCVHSIEIASIYITADVTYYWLTTKSTER